MKLLKKDIGCALLEPTIIKDGRGWFQIPFNIDEINSLGLKFDRVFQLNHSYTSESGIIRGPNYQKRPYNQAKVVRVIKGSVYSVGIDIDPKSRNYGCSVGYTLSARNKRLMYIPNTFAHGFTVLEDDTELEYLTDNYYNSAAAKSIQFDDSFYNHGKGIDWSVNNTVELNLINRSEKNRKAPGLMDADY